MTIDINEINTTVILVKTSLGKWHNTKQDAELKEKIAKIIGADVDRLSAGKKLAHSPVIKQLSKLHGQFTNQIIRKMTVPWATSVHMIRCDLVDQFEEKWQAKKDVFDELLPELRAEYHNYIEQDRALLGDSFHAAEYPPIDDVIDCYYADYEYDFLPVSNDIRVELPASKLTKMKADCEKRVTGKVENAMKVVHQRVVTTLEDLIAGLERHGLKPEGAQKAGNFSGNNIQKVRELADILPSLNLTGDPALTEAANDLIEKLDIGSAEELRKDDGKRMATAEKARTIVSKLAGFYD